MDPIDIQYELKKRNIPQAQIAREAGVNQMYVSRVIRGRAICAHLMDIISGKLGKDPREVFDKYPEPVIHNKA